MEQSYNAVLFEPLFQAISAFFKQYGFSRDYWMAYSGGLDSHALLSLCHRAKTLFPSLQLHAVHIQHGLHPQAAEWGKHCRAVCHDLHIDYHEREITLSKASGDSLEALARKKRYVALSACMAPGDILLTAHHQDDQAETVLLQLLRGSGPKGLAAMPAIKILAQGLHARPLLPFPRALLQQYAEAHQLNWIEDPSNLHQAHARNFIRHHTMPLLKQRWPAAANMLARSASHCAKLQQFTNECLEQALNQASGSRADTLSVAALLSMPAIRQRLVLRQWIHASGFSLPSEKKMNHICEDVLLAAWDRLPCVRWGNVELRRYRDDLYLMAPLADMDTTQVLAWDMKQLLPLSGGRVLVAVEGQDRGLVQKLESVIVSFRQGGERIWLHGKHHSLKHFFQEQGILPWVRNRLPLIWAGQKLMCIPGLFLDTRFATSEKEAGYEITVY